MLTTGIILLILALGAAGNGLAQFNVHREYGEVYAKQFFENPGFAWLCAGGIVFILAAILLIRALSMKKANRSHFKLSYFFGEFATFLLGAAGVVYGLLRNSVVTVENAARLAADETAVANPLDGTVWVIVGGIAALLGLLFLIIQTLKKTNPAFAQKVESGKVYRFFRDYRSEMKKIVWSPKKDVVRNTSVVVATLVIVGILVGALDFGFTQIILLIGGIGA